MLGRTRNSKQETPRTRGWLNAVVAVAALAATFAAGGAQAANPKEVYRFYHLDAGRHFYTASETERDKVLAQYPRFAYEGVAFYAHLAEEPGTTPVYRFYHQGNGSHVYTAQETEKQFILANYPIYAYEGIAYYGASSNASGGRPLFRLFNTKLGTHFFTMSSSEATYAVNTWPQFVYEGPQFFIWDSATPGGGPGGNIAPKVTIISSAAQVTVPANVSITASPTDTDGTVAKVEFYQGYTKIGEATAAPWSVNYQANVAGDFSFSAVATDNAGATGASNMVTVKAIGGAPPPPGNVAPKATLLTSASSIGVPGSVMLTATATDDDGTISKVMFYQGTTKLGELTTGPYVYTFNTSVAGNFAFSAVAVDNVGATGTSNTVAVAATTGGGGPTLPTVSFSMSGSLVQAPTTVTLTATATATGAAVTRVGFFQNGVKLIDDTAAPYTHVVNITTAGTYTFSVDVSDSLGQSSSSLTQQLVASNPPPVVTTSADVWRLLNQATFGASQGEAARVMSLGIAGWIDDQFTKPMVGYPDTKYNKLQITTSVDCTTSMPGGGNYPATSPQAICSRDHLTLAMLQRDFFVNANTAPDQLRQRVAWALSQILVTSGNEQDLSYAYVMSRYQNLMFQEAFGNFRTLLEKVTYNPAMGNYLDMVNNNKASGTRVPNENYAREIMQLFSVGLDELNMDGTPILDASSKPVPTYGQTEIAEFAKVFTGYTYADALNPTAPRTAASNTRWYGAPMVPYTATATTGHDTTAKVLLNGTPVPAGQTGKQDIDAAVLNVFMHPNTPPFVAKQMIQRLVTGNPTPAYVGRMAAVFANNGSGVRGDMRALVRAILLDPEARGPAKTDPNFGSLKEPVLMVTGMLRALSGITDGARLEGATNNLGQRPYFSPTVFNYFPPDQTIPGTAVLGPEFAIHTTNTAVNRANLVYTLVYGGYNPDVTIPNATGTKLNLLQFESLADNPAAMISAINDVLLGGSLPAAQQALIMTAVNTIGVPATLTAAQRTDRARMAVYLMASSYDYQVQR